MACRAQRRHARRAFARSFASTRCIMLVDHARCICFPYVRALGQAMPIVEVFRHPHRHRHAGIRKHHVRYKVQFQYVLGHIIFKYVTSHIHATRQICMVNCSMFILVIILSRIVYECEDQVTEKKSILNGILIYTVPCTVVGSAPLAWEPLVHGPPHNRWRSHEPQRRRRRHGRTYTARPTRLLFNSGIRMARWRIGQLHGAGKTALWTVGATGSCAMDVKRPTWTVIRSMVAATRRKHTMTHVSMHRWCSLHYRCNLVASYSISSIRMALLPSRPRQTVQKMAHALDSHWIRHSQPRASSLCIASMALTASMTCAAVLYRPESLSTP